MDWPEPRFITGTTGVVTDTLTGLIWLKDANCWGKQDWATAIVSATALSSGECGLSDGSAAGDWRLPNVRELYSLLHSGVYNPAVPNTAGLSRTLRMTFASIEMGGLFFWNPLILSEKIQHRLFQAGVKSVSTRRFDQDEE